MASRAAAVIGGLFCAGGGYLFGYAAGYEALVNQVTGLISSAADGIPLVGTTVGNEINSYVSGQLSQSYGGYQAGGAVLFLLGLVVIIAGTRKSKQTMVQVTQPQVQVSTATTPVSASAQSSVVFCRYCGAKAAPGTKFCSGCGRALG